jgi:hypothetical protein
MHRLALSMAGVALAMASPATAADRRSDAVIRALDAHLKARHKQPLPRTARYAMAFADLNGDGRAEAIVHVVDQAWCGSGGCTTFVFSPLGQRDWSWVGSMTINRPPIYVLPSKHHGWHDLGVSVRGGFAAVPFRGSRYALNPTVPPAKPASPKGKLLIADKDGQLRSVQNH